MAVNFVPSIDSDEVAYVGRLDVLLEGFEISLRQLQPTPKGTVQVYVRRFQLNCLRVSVMFITFLIVQLKKFNVIFQCLLKWSII